MATHIPRLKQPGNRSSMVNGGIGSWKGGRMGNRQVPIIHIEYRIRRYVVSTDFMISRRELNDRDQRLTGKYMKEGK